MKVYDSYSGEIKDFLPIENNKVKMYVCGPTVYDFPHLGHARCYITWDMVSKYLRFKGYEVTYVRNITDVDDKIIEKARKTEETTHQIASKYYKEFKNAMHKLNIADPDIEPKATDNIKEMINMIKILIEKGFAYDVNGDVYFRVKKFQNYGELSNQAIKDLEAGARVETSEIKEDPLDFTLWKAVKTEDEIGWDSPWGKGRPGWHIECSAMSKKFLGDTIDIHAGGQDLLFPHHENERAQSECSTGKQFVKYWLHNGFVTINSEKMSKSLGNFTTIDDVLKKYDSNTIRFFILTNHYRMPIEFNDEALTSAKQGVKRLKNSYLDVSNAIKEQVLNEALTTIKNCVKSPDLTFEGIPSQDSKNISNAIKTFIEAMDNDFNTSKALAVLFEMSNQAQKTKELENKNISALYLATMLILSDILGFDLKQKEEANSEIVDSLMELIIKIRTQARVDKNWALSDQIRDELKAAGISLKDSKDGTNWILED